MNTQQILFHAIQKGIPAKETFFLRRSIASIITTPIFIVIAFSLMASYPSSTVFAYYPSDRDMRFLPPYCIARLQSNKVATQEVAKWKNLFGRKTWTSFHHYCQGINYVNRGSTGLNEETKVNDFKKGIENLNYHLKAYGVNFPLRAQTFYLLGTAYIGVDRKSEAINALNNAINIKPRYPSAYRKLSDLYLELGDVKKAAITIDNGLKKSPKSKSLLKKKKKIQRINKDN